MVEMKKYKLGDVRLKITDGSHFSPKAVDFGYPMYSVKDMNEFGFNDSDYNNVRNSDKVEKNYILVKKKKNTRVKMTL